MIEIKGLRKTFDGFPAVDDLNMTVPSGAIYGLVGPNGAGKSTTIRVLTGILRAEAGTVLVDGCPTYENPAVKKKIAFIPDEIWFFPQANLQDMMKFYKGIYKSFDVDRWKKLGDAFGLDERQPLRKFSRGMKKQAAFRLALSMRPEYLILDEPVDGLDPVMRRQVWSLVMMDAAECGTTVLVSSHNLRELEEVCDHVGIMNRGKMLIECAVECGKNLELFFMEKMGGVDYDVKNILL